jgi:two-component system sensor histidine kinase VanS
MAVRSRRRGPSVRLRFTLSYAAFVLLAGSICLAAVGAYLLRYVPEGAIDSTDGFIPNRSDLARAFTPAAVAAVTFLLAVGLVGGWFLSGRMLTPLARIGDAARSAAGGSLSHRIDLAGRRDEFTDLADTFDAMLERLEAHLAEGQRFAANASHELRTPLATAQALLEVASRDPDPDVDVLVERLRTVNARAVALTEALLLLARGERGLPDPERVDLSLLVEDASETAIAAAESRCITLVVTGDPAHVRGSEQLLHQLVRNLMENAIVHNLPSEGLVAVHTSAWEGVATLRVENTGAVLTPELVATLAEPFRRGAERVQVAGEHAGVGLGLAIVQSIARAHDGALALKPRAGGGLIATVRLPLAAD